MTRKERVDRAMLHLNALKNNGGYGFWLDDLMALLPEFASKNATMQAAIEDIANQKKTTELETEYDVEVADFEDGYDTIIDVARKALSASS